MPTVPADFKRVLATNPAVAAKWRDLTSVAQRDFTRWIEGAKQETTRKRRIAVACDKLRKGDRRPCCYAVVPFALYKALAAHPKAKTTWSALTADQKRDLVDWVESVEPAARKVRIEKACEMLAKGKKRA